MLTVAPIAWPLDGRTTGFHARADAFADDGRDIETAGYDGGEFLTAQSSDDVARAHAGARHLREDTDDFVADGVPEAVVDRLEVIEIEHQDGRRLRAAAPARDTGSWRSPGKRAG